MKIFTLICLTLILTSCGSATSEQYPTGSGSVVNVQQGSDNGALWFLGGMAAGNMMGGRNNGSTTTTYIERQVPVRTPSRTTVRPTPPKVSVPRSPARAPSRSR